MGSCWMDRGGCSDGMKPDTESSTRRYKTSQRNHPEYQLSIAMFIQAILVSIVAANTLSPFSSLHIRAPLAAPNPTDTLDCEEVTVFDANHWECTQVNSLADIDLTKFDCWEETDFSAFDCEDEVGDFECDEVPGGASSTPSSALGGTDPANNKPGEQASGGEAAPESQPTTDPSAQPASYGDASGSSALPADTTNSPLSSANSVSVSMSALAILAMML
jgi:hypothetical protein